MGGRKKLEDSKIQFFKAISKKRKPHLFLNR